MAPPDGSAVQAPCLAAFRHGRLRSSQFAFASAGRCAAALLGQCTVIKIVDFWVQVVLFAFDSVSFGTRQTLSRSPRRWYTIDWRPVCDQFMGLIAGQLSSIFVGLDRACWTWQVRCFGRILRADMREMDTVRPEATSTGQGQDRPGAALRNNKNAAYSRGWE
jgi:hypothetical protein